jgi:hypothetical protein
MGPALKFLYSQNYFDVKIVEEAKSFAREAVEFAIKKIEAQNGNETVKEILIERLNQIEIVAGIPEDLMKVEEIYDELKLKSDESYVKTYLEVDKYLKKLELEPKESWRRKLNENCSNFNVKYFEEENILSD